MELMGKPLDMDRLQRRAREINAQLKLGQEIMEALKDGEASERDLFYRLQPDRVALHRCLKQLWLDRCISQRERGRLPGPVVTMYRLTGHA